jgi:hypothetical protein
MWYAPDDDGGCDMSLFADICRGYEASDDEISFDEASGTWTVDPAFGLDKPLPGIPSKEMAMAICRALYACYENGCEAASNS